MSVSLAVIAGACTPPAPPTVSEADMPPPPGVSPALDSLRAIRGKALTVSFYSYGPSDVFFERFGHAALAVRDDSSGIDVAYNWGMFDFAQPNFLGRFLTGDTKYSMVGFPTGAFNNVYRGDNRTIRQQVLALTPVERAALQEFLNWNAREENKYYRYDYYRDNCSTRLRDALDRVLGGKLHPALMGPGRGITWRGETARLLGSMLPLYAGIEIALGRHADEPLSKWDEEFLPEHMAAHFESLVLTDASGARRKLVARDTVIFTADRVPLPTEAPDRVAMSALLGLAVAGLLALLADARSSIARVALTVIVALWYFVGGLLGTALLLAGTITKHIPYMGANTTLLALQPLLLLAAFVVPWALARRSSSRAALGISLVIASLSVCAVLTHFVPAWTQSNGVVLATVVPIHIAIALAVWRLDRGTSNRPA